MDRKVGFQTPDGEQAGDELLSISGAVRVPELPDDFAAGGDLEGPATIRFSHQGIAVGQPLAGAAGFAEEGLLGCAVV